MNKDSWINTLVEEDKPKYFYRFVKLMIELKMNDKDIIKQLKHFFKTKNDNDRYEYLGETVFNLMVEKDENVWSTVNTDKKFCLTCGIEHNGRTAQCESCGMEMMNKYKKEHKEAMDWWK